MGFRDNKFRGIYASVSPEGDIRIPSEEGAEGAVKREYETTDGKSGVKWEKLASEVYGHITDIRFKDGDFGVSLNVTLDDGEMPLILSMPAEGNYAIDLLKKLPNVNLTQEVILKPYSMKNKKGKLVRGITVKQGETKVASFFSRLVEGTTDKFENINGFPTNDPEQVMDKSKWKKYFFDVFMFLKEYTEKNIIPNVKSNIDFDISAAEPMPADDEINVGEIPFADKVPADDAPENQTEVKTDSD